MPDVFIRLRISSDMNLDYDPEHCARFPFFSHSNRIWKPLLAYLDLAVSKDKEKFRTQSAINQNNAELSLYISFAKNIVFVINFK